MLAFEHSGAMTTTQCPRSSFSRAQSGRGFLMIEGRMTAVMKDINGYIGLEGLVPHLYKNWNAAEQIIEEAREAGKTLIMFRGVANKKFLALQANREDLEIKFKLTYCENDNLLIVQVPSMPHEACHR